MNRRSMLSFLGLGAVAGSAIGTQSGINLVPSTASGLSYGLDAPKIAVEDRAGYIKKMQEDLSSLSDPSKWIADRLAEELKDWRMGYSPVRYAEIDPDIRNMKSITESAKMRMFFERKVRRMHEMQKTSISHRLAEYMGMTG